MHLIKFGTLRLQVTLPGQNHPAGGYAAFGNGATERAGKVADGNTVTDFDAEEKKRHISMASAVASIEYKSKKLNFIDTPGLFDFEQGAFEGLRAAETAVIVVSARSGLAVGAEKAFKNARLPAVWRGCW